MTFYLNFLKYVDRLLQRWILCWIFTLIINISPKRHLYQELILLTGLTTLFVPQQVHYHLKMLQSTKIFQFVLHQKRYKCHLLDLTHALNYAFRNFTFWKSTNPLPWDCRSLWIIHHPVHTYVRWNVQYSNMYWMYIHVCMNYVILCCYIK